MFSSKRRYALIAALVAAILIIPAAVFASNGFGDVPDSEIFHGDIEWMATNGITSGCGGGNYCPDDNVSRGQMAAFMKRLATKKVVNAATAETAETAETAVSATTATTADNGVTVQGYYDRTDFYVDGFSTFTNPSVGVYCLGLDPALGIEITDVVVQLTVEWGSSVGSDLSAFWWRGSGSCPLDNIEVRTYEFASSGGSVTGVQLSSGAAFVVSVWETPGLINLTAPVSVVTDIDTNGS